MNGPGDNRPARPEATRARFVAMALLAAAFLLRVVGQAALVAGWASWLPPLAEWQSGLLPYPALLAAQLVILVGLAVVQRDLRRGGRFATPGRFATVVRGFAGAYAGSMLLRYALTRLAHPDWGALGHTIPIWLHLALAAWLWWWAAPVRPHAPTKARSRTGEAIARSRPDQARPRTCIASATRETPTR